MKMQLPTSGQVYTGLRYAGTMAGTVGTIAALIGVTDQQTAQSIVAALQAVIHDLTQLFGDTSKLVLLVIPVATIWLSKIGYSSANPEKQKQAIVADNPNVVVVETNNPAAAKQVANAAATIPEVQKVVSTQAIADSTPSDKIVSK